MKEQRINIMTQLEKKRRMLNKAQAEYRQRRKALNYVELHRWIPAELWLEIQDCFLEAIDLTERNRMSQCPMPAFHQYKRNNKS